MIEIKNIETIFNDCSELGFQIDYNDIVYCLVRDKFEDASLAYMCVFGCDIETAKLQSLIYDDSGKVSFLKAHLLLYDDKKKTPSKKNSPSITYDENLAYMLKLKAETEEAKRLGDMDTKDAIKILTDITVKINDRFKVNDDNKGQIVVVETKYNDVCDYCQHEVARAPMTKEEAMEIYNLVEKK